MTGRQAALAVALVFAARVALAQDRAVPRDGGSSGGSSAGQGHHAGSSSGGSSHSGGSSSGGSSSGGSSSSAGFSHDPTPAQRRHPRAGTGTGHQGGYYYGSPYYYSGYYPYYASPYYGWGFGLGYYSPYYYSGFYGYAPVNYTRGADVGSLRVIVEPVDTRVYVDGYYAGVVDDFDGIFQRLNLAPGRHEISLRLDGHKTQNFKVYVGYDQTIKIRHEMVPGSPTDVNEETIGRPEDIARAERPRPRYAEDERSEAEGRGEAEPGRDEAPGDFGTLRLDVEPSDASIYVDGAFRGTARMRSLRLPAGRHRIEVVRPGYRTLEQDVDVEPGRDVDVRFELERG